MSMFYYVYILQSEKDGRTYVGSTSNLETRLKEHNSGKVKTTRYRAPLKIVYYEKFNSQQEAFQKERFYKTSWGRRRLKKILSKRLE